MRIRSLVLLTGIMCAGTAGADIRDAQFTQNENCPRTVFQENTRDFSGLVQLASTGIDGISVGQSFEEMAAQQKLPASDIEKAKKGLGDVVCPGTRFKNGGKLRGVVVDSDDQIITNAHAFIDDRGIPVDPLSKCYFENAQGEKRYLDIGDGLLGGNYKLGSKRPYDEPDEFDHAVVRFKRCTKTFKKNCGPINGAAFSVDASETELKSNTPVTLVSIGMRSYQCKARIVVAPSNLKGSSLLTNCPGPDGGSAGAVFSIDPNNPRLKLEGIVTGSADSSKDNHAFSLKERNFTKAITITRGVLSNVLALSTKHDQMAQGNGPAIPIIKIKSEGL